MATDDASMGPEPLTFESNLESKQKKGAHKPVYAAVFSQKSRKMRATKRVHLLVNPYAGNKTGRSVGEKAKALLELSLIHI